VTRRACLPVARRRSDDGVSDSPRMINSTVGWSRSAAARGGPTVSDEEPIRTGPGAASNGPLRCVRFVGEHFLTAAVGSTSCSARRSGNRRHVHRPSSPGIAGPSHGTGAQQPRRAGRRLIQCDGARTARIRKILTLAKPRAPPPCRGSAGAGQPLLSPHSGT
jgi:hypothetical protein